MLDDTLQLLLVDSVCLPKVNPRQLHFDTWLNKCVLCPHLMSTNNTIIRMVEDYKKEKIMSLSVTVFWFPYTVSNQCIWFIGIEILLRDWQICCNHTKLNNSENIYHGWYIGTEECVSGGDLYSHWLHMWITGSRYFAKKHDVFSCDPITANSF